MAPLPTPDLVRHLAQHIGGCLRDGYLRALAHPHPAAKALEALGKWAELRESIAVLTPAQWADLRVQLLAALPDQPVGLSGDDEQCVVLFAQQLINALGDQHVLHALDHLAKNDGEEQTALCAVHNWHHVRRFLRYMPALAWVVLRQKILELLPTDPPPLPAHIVVHHAPSQPSAKAN